MVVADLWMPLTPHCNLATLHQNARDNPLGQPMGEQWLASCVQLGLHDLSQQTRMPNAVDVCLGPRPIHRHRIYGLLDRRDPMYHQWDFLPGTIVTLLKRTSNPEVANEVLQNPFQLATQVAQGLRLLQQGAFRDLRALEQRQLGRHE